MSNIENCADCGKRFGFTESIFRKTNGLWICEDCNIKQIQENDNKDQKIADLEAKLKESEEQIWSLENQKLHAHNCLNKLKQQLAEKEKEIENLNNRILISQLQAPKEQILNILGHQCRQYNPDQDKISFAVEQLEQIFSDFNKKVDDEFGDNDVKYITLDIEDVNFYLQDKIKSIKEGK